MNKEQQDKIWKDLSEESKKKVKAEYLENIQEAHNSENSDEMVNVLLGKNEMLIDLFGYHNLNLEPIKKEGWVNVYYTYDGDRTKREVLNMIFSTKEEAETGKDNCINYIATVKIEWEE